MRATPPHPQRVFMQQRLVTRASSRREKGDRRAHRQSVPRDVPSVAGMSAGNGAPYLNDTRIPRPLVRLRAHQGSLVQQLVFRCITNCLVMALLHES